MTYHRAVGGPIELLQSGTSPFFGLPGPPMPIGPVGPQGPAASLFPTTVRWGDVVTVSGPFQSLSQGMVRVKFAGVPWMAPQMIGPFTASVIVPDGAQTGECMVEVNGQVVFGTQCSVTPASTVNGGMMRPRERRGIRIWKNFGDMSRMGGYEPAGSCCAACASGHKACGATPGGIPLTALLLLGVAGFAAWKWL